jgi:uncharacterized membrane protein YhhN
MSNSIFLLPLGIAVIDWFAVALKMHRLEYFFKPGVILALLACLWLLNSSASTIWFALGLILSLVGDIFLMLPRERFTAGLIAFLLAHIAYGIGLNPSPPPFNPASLVVALLLTLVGAQLYQRLSAGLTARRLNRLKKPILAYVIVISLMVLSALLTLLRPAWPPLSAMLLSAGALLFLLSDVLLAWDHFVSCFSFGRTPRMIAYHLGQLFITMGALAFLK